MKLAAEVRLRLSQLRALHARFGELVRAERRLLALAFFALGGEILFQVLARFPIKYLGDGLLAPPAGGALLWGVPPGYPAEHPHLFLGAICVGMVAIALLGGACAYASAVASATAGQRMVFKLRKRLYAHLQRLSLRFHHERGLGDILMRLTGDIAMLRDILSTSFVDLVGHAGSVLVISAILVAIDPPLALIALAVISVVGILLGISSARIAKTSKEQRMHEGVLADTAGEALESIALVKAFGCEGRMLEAFARRNRSSMRKSVKTTRLQEKLSQRVEILFAAGLAAVFAAGALRVGPSFTFGDLLVVVSFIHLLNKPLRKLAGMASRIGKATACGDRVLEIFAREPEEVDAPGAREAPPLRGDIRIEGVAFGYEPARSVLSEVTVEIPAGQHVGIVGRNGSGKSTLIHLILRFFEPGRGRILIDGVDIRSYTIRSLRAQISIALQSTLLFGDAIRENLLCAAPEATDEAMYRALDLVGADFVRRLGEGIDTQLAAQGVNLSGGERRKLALAAAVLRDAPILILDEPTTHIDQASQQDIIRRFADLTHGRTALVISHDPAMLEHLDRVLHLEDGRIAGDGTHRDLAERSASYRALFPDGRRPEMAWRP